jgi:DNA-nicking Smr family endonuclease
MTSKRSPVPTEEERMQFREAVAGAKPIVPDKVHHEPPPPPAKPIQRWKDEAAALTESLSPEPLDLRLEGGDEPAFLRPGLARTVLRACAAAAGWCRTPSTCMAPPATRRACCWRIAESLRRGLRARVVHGKGPARPDASRC